MISPQNLAIGAAAVGMAGKEGDLFRKVVGWSLVLFWGDGRAVYLQSTAVLEWMVIKCASPVARLRAIGATSTWSTAGARAAHLRVRRAAAVQGQPEGGGAARQRGGGPAGGGGAPRGVGPVGLGTGRRLGPQRRRAAGRGGHPIAASRMRRILDVSWTTPG